MNQKAKGSKAERELIRLFWESGWGAMRAAGSGSTQFPSPDILVGNKVRRLAIEVKVTKDNKKYFPKEEIRQLLNFASYFGAEPWLAIKFSGIAWTFINPEDLEDSGENMSFGTKDIDKKGLSFEQLTSI